MHPATAGALRDTSDDAVHSEWGSNESASSNSEAEEVAELENQPNSSSEQHKYLISATSVRVLLA